MQQSLREAASFKMLWALWRRGHSTLGNLVTCIQGYPTLFKDCVESFGDVIDDLVADGYVDMETDRNCYFLTPEGRIVASILFTDNDHERVDPFMPRFQAFVYNAYKKIHGGEVDPQKLAGLSGIPSGVFVYGRHLCEHSGLPAMVERALVKYPSLKAVVLGPLAKTLLVTLHEMEMLYGQNPDGFAVHEINHAGLWYAYPQSNISRSSAKLVKQGYVERQKRKKQNPAVPNKSVTTYRLGPKGRVLFGGPQTL